jgi:hypothetical protein
MRSILAAFLVLVMAPAILAADETKLESQGEGLQTATFNTFSGTVPVNLPEDIVAGDSFSGTVVAEPEGDSQKKKDKNHEALIGYVFELGDHPRGSVGDGRLKLDVPETPGSATLILREVRKGKPGREIGRVEIPVLDTAPEIPEFHLPSITQQNIPLRVSGPFDGDLESSVLRIGGVDALPLAESPRGAIFRSPIGVSGVAPITLHEAGEPVAQGEVRNIATNLSAPKSNLAAGESTTLTTLVTGLEDLDEDIPLRLRFWPSAIITVQDGYDHVKTIRPEDVGPDGTYSFGVRVTGRSPGGWGASVRVKVPEPTLVDRYVLVLNGKSVGEIEPVSGIGRDAAGREPVAFNAGLDLADPYYDWLRANLSEGPQNRDGQIVGVDASGNGVESTDFRQAHVAMIDFPGLDGDDESLASMQVTLNSGVVSFQKKNTLKVDGLIGPQTKNWHRSNFRIDIGDLPAERVGKIGSFRWKQEKAEGDRGVELRISGAAESSWARWHRAFYIIDRSVPTAGGPRSDVRLVFLGPDGHQELGALEFHETTFSSLEIHSGSAADTREVSIVLVGSKLNLDRKRR